MSVPLKNQTMRCIEITEPGDASVLVIGKRNIPEPKAGEVLIQTKAAGVNRPDILQRQGHYPVPAEASDLLGLEVSGYIIKTGKNVNKWQIGDAVCALVPGGGYAEFVTTPAEHCLVKPESLNFVEAAALPETFFTVWHNLFQRGQLKANETILIYGGASGIGTTAIQLAKYFGATVLTTASTEEKTQACLRLGADAVFNYNDENFIEALKEKTAKQGIDVILDMVSGDYVAHNIDLAANDGRIVCLAALGGKFATIDVLKLMRKRLILTGSTLRSQSTQAKAKIASELRKHICPALEKNMIKPQIFASFPLAEVANAHNLLEQGQHFGKVVLTL